MKRTAFLKSLLAVVVAPFVVKNLMAEEPIISEFAKKELKRWDQRFPKKENFVRQYPLIPKECYNIIEISLKDSKYFAPLISLPICEEIEVKICGEKLMASIRGNPNYYIRVEKKNDYIIGEMIRGNKDYDLMFEKHIKQDNWSLKWARYI